ncbi:integrase/recombinase XerC [Apibacter mensalis]|uniref:Integrase/recombinase XerC n=1 Tax=Apibacter mensalis TaxID=1586267 RepID=A0A0X3ANX3_9FLAO|nr:tyrosine-type recombinase/integrase [Apibacter mensalis]CVK16080.1 integrase/recombinase XerC [Apibacter mensalis]
MLQKFLEYLNLEKHYSPNTIQSYERDLLDLQIFLLETEGISDIDQATARQLRNFIIYLSNKKLSEKSINRKISSIRSFFKFLLKIGYLEINPTIYLLNLKQKKKILVPYTEDEIYSIENYIHTSEAENENSDSFETIRNHLIFEIFYQTGIRRMELLQLKTSKIDLNKNTIIVTGKRNKERLIPITQKLSNQISKFLAYKIKFGIPYEYLFTNKTGKTLSEKYIYNLIHKYLSIVTTKEKRSPHMLRHTFASHLLHNGAEINSIKELLGHNSLAATQVYTYNTIEDLKKVFNLSHPFGHKNK